MIRDILTHLPEDALDDVLIGMGSVDSEAHLAHCPECRAKIEEFGKDVRLFNQASMAWSEARPRRPLEQARLAPAPRMPFALMGSAAAAALAIAVALSIGHHETPQNRIGTDARIGDSQTQIAQDNQLMVAVNAAIGPQEVSPLDEYGLSKRHAKHGKAHPK
jgi:predicted anti-sigma-YlaC factor YlaD